MILGLLQNDASLLGCRLDELRGRVRLTPPERPDAVGAGYVQNGNALVRKRPATRDELIEDPLSLVADVQATGVLVQVRRGTVGRYDEQNTHPFRYGNWIFAHSGGIDDFSAIRPALLERLPPFLRRSIQGDTDSEHLFALFLAHLKELAFLDSHLVPPELLATAMGRTVREIERLLAESGRDGRSLLDLVATNGSSLVAARRGERPMAYAVLEGMTACPRHKLSPEAPETHPWRLPHHNLRTVVVTTGAAPDGWPILQDGEVLAAGSDIHAHVAQITAG